MNKELVKDPIAAWESFHSELVIGLVGAVGTEMRRVAQVLQSQLELAGYGVDTVQISEDVIPLVVKPDHYFEGDRCERINKLMDAGNEARRKSKDNSVLALGASSLISNMREKSNNGQIEPRQKQAVIINSLKHPDEVERLRSIYPMGFVLIGVYSDEDSRLDYLENQLGVKLEDAKKLMSRDESEQQKPYGQRLTKTFCLADFFVRPAGSEAKLRNDLKRIVHLLFGDPFITPSFDEFAMHMAFASALRSADLSRQVGAVVAKDKQLLSSGANDCPRCGGGLYWPEIDDHGKLADSENGRDYVRGFDSNRAEQDKMISEIIQLAKLRNENEKAAFDLGQLETLLGQKASPIRALTEYGRVVHAEMEALLAVARSNNSTIGSTVYCTTFPCHNCAKHIVAAGVTRVVYIEPYEKSKAPSFHDDSIVFGFEKNTEKKVMFQPFLGVGPRRFFDLFSMGMSSGYDVTRKETDGTKKNWDVRTSPLRVRMWPRSYLDHELDACEIFARCLSCVNDDAAKNEES